MNALNHHVTLMQHVTIQLGHSSVHVTKVLLETEQIVQILMSVLNLHATPMHQMQPAITHMGHLHACVIQVILVMVLNVKTLMNVQIAVSVIPMLPALIQKAPTCVLAIRDTQEMVPTVQFSTIAQKQHTVATKMHHVMSLMMQHMMETQLVHVTKGSLAMVHTVMILMNVLKLHATPMQPVTIQSGHICVHATKGILEMEQIA
jgi:hypothetical protein